MTEYGYGNWEGLTDAEIRQQYPEARKARSADKWNSVIPGGESYAQLWNRAVAWLAKVSEDSHAVAVTHMKVSRMIMAAYSGRPPEAMLALGHRQGVIYRLHEQQITTIDCE